MAVIRNPVGADLIEGLYRETCLVEKGMLMMAPPEPSIAPSDIVMSVKMTNKSSGRFGTWAVRLSEGQCDSCRWLIKLPVPDSVIEVVGLVRDAPPKAPNGGIIGTQRETNLLHQQ